MNMKFASFIILFLLCITGKIVAQNAGRLGLGLGISGDTWVGIIYHPSESFALRPSFHFNAAGYSGSDRYQSQGGSVTSFSNEQTGFGLGVSAIWDLSVSDDLIPYIGTGISYLKNIIESESHYKDQSRDTTTTQTQSTNSMSYNGVFGVRYAVAKRFHLFGEVSAGYRHSNTSYIPEVLRTSDGWNFSLSSSAIGAYFYFN